LHNKPLGCGASEVYASDPACEEEEEPIIIILTKNLRADVGNVLHHSVLNLVISCLLFKNLKINISNISVTLSVVVYGCEAWTLH